MNSIHWLAMVTLSVTGLLSVGLAFLQKRKVGFGLVVLAALGGGAALGLALPQALEYLAPVSAVYLKLLTAVVAPLVVVSILAALLGLEGTSQLRTLGLRSIGWLLLNTFLAILLALGVGLWAGVGRGAEIPSDPSGLEDRLVPFGDVFVGFFPGNLVKDLQSNAIIPLIVSALIVAAAFLVVQTKHPERVAPFRSLVEAVKAVVDQVVKFLVLLTPYGVLVLVAQAVGRSQNLASFLQPLLWLLGVTFAVCAVHIWLVNGALVALAARRNPLEFFRAVLEAQVTAFSTQTSVGTLPVTTQALTQRLGVSEKVAHFVAPLGTTIGMPGCAGIWPVLLAVFAINALGLPYSLTQYGVLVVLALVVSLGTAGVPGTATMTATTVFAAAGLPLEVIVLTLPISTVADMARTATNVTAAAASAVIVDRLESPLRSTR